MVSEVRDRRLLPHQGVEKQHGNVCGNTYGNTLLID